MTAPTGRSVVAAVVGVAKAFGMATVAEGVETVEQVRALRDLGVDALQGFAFAPPMAIDELVERLAEPSPWAVPRADLDAATR